jgi:hypothetical protein
MVLAVLVWLAAAYFVTRKKATPESQATTAAALDPSAPASSAARTGTASASASAAPSAAPTPKDVDACVRRLFPAGSFGEGAPKLDFVCTQADAVRGAGELQSILVTEGRGEVSQGMREWAGLDWYSLPAFAMMRVTCCAEPPTLVWKSPLACPIDEAMRTLEAVAPGGSDEAVEAAIEEYGKTARCLEQFNQRAAFGQTGAPGAGGTALKRFIAQARQKKSP